MDYATWVKQQTSFDAKEWSERNDEWVRDSMNPIRLHTPFLEKMKTLKTQEGKIRVIPFQNREEWCYSKLPQNMVHFLDAGCLFGRFALNVAYLQPDCEIIALDMSRTLLSLGDKMRKEAELNKCIFVLSPIEELEMKNQFDGICAAQVLEHVFDFNHCMKVLKRALSENGVFVGSVSISPTPSREHLRAFPNEQDVQNKFKAFYRKVETAVMNAGGPEDVCTFACQGKL